MQILCWRMSMKARTYHVKIACKVPTSFSFILRTLVQLKTETPVRDFLAASGARISPIFLACKLQSSFTCSNSVVGAQMFYLCLVQWELDVEPRKYNAKIVVYLG